MSSRVNEDLEDEGESKDCSKRSTCNRLFLVLSVAYRLMEGRTIYTWLYQILL